jgi:nucleoside-diphosphate-sugar epimerase
MNILITGANGFVGQALCQHLARQSPFIQQIYAAIRHPDQAHQINTIPHLLPTITPSLNDLASNQLLSQVDCIVHLAARVHQMHDRAAHPLAEFRAVNATATATLALAAAKAGVRRFIYLSSIKVHGEKTSHDSPYQETDQLTPLDPYGISKWEAEQQLRSIAAQTGLEVVIIRPPLIYGPRVKANFLQMMKVVQKDIPLPLGAIRNRRSLIYVENLVDAIQAAIIHPAAANETFLVSDGADLSTPQLIRHIAPSLNKSPKLLPIPVSCLRFIGKLAGKSAAIERLTGSLVVDSSKIRHRLNWTPPYTVDQGLKATAEWFKSSFP